MLVLKSDRRSRKSEIEPFTSSLNRWPDLSRRGGDRCFESGGEIPSRATVGTVAPSILAGFKAGAEELRIPTRLMASGASHDAAAFAHAGIPMGMLFVRNANGSHNPFEQMEMADLLEATRLLTWWLAKNFAE